jgi:hypothetical protein
LDAVHDRVDVPEPLPSNVRVRLQANPALGETVSASVTVLVNPFSGLTVTVEFSLEPTFPTRLEGPATTVKSWVVKVAVAVWESVPLVPVMTSA